MIKRIFASAVAALSVVACATAVSAIDNTKLVVTELNGTEYVPQTEVQASMDFAGNNLSATVGGNIINANYKEGKDGALTISEGAMTRMMVPDSFREDEFVDAINAIASYKVEGNEISFIDADGNVVIKAVKAE